MTELALIPHGQEWSDMKNMAQIFVRSGLLPNSVNTPEKALVIMMQGRELGIPPMQAFSKINVIQGKPTQAPELMLSLVRRKYGQAKILFKKMTKTECVIEAARPGDEPQTFTFTMEDAAAMGLAAKDNWKKMPKTMLKWRCVADMCRTLFPECLMGVSYAPEELNPNIVVNEQGDVIEKTITPKESPQQEDKNPEIIDGELANPLTQMDADEKYSGTPTQKIELMKMFEKYGVSSTSDMKKTEAHIMKSGFSMAEAEVYLNGGE